jgi:hypothetical protein
LYTQSAQKHTQQSSGITDDFIALVASVAKLRTILANSYFDIALKAIEDCLRLFERAGIPMSSEKEKSIDVNSLHPVVAVMLAHFLMLAIPFETRRGKFATADGYLSLLHDLMDKSETITDGHLAAVGLLDVSRIFQDHSITSADGIDQSTGSARLLRDARYHIYRC